MSLKESRLEDFVGLGRKGQQDTVSYESIHQICRRLSSDRPNWRAWGCA